MRGSWAGAMGHFQFMPSTFITYAVDGDGDGKIDIWNNFTDAAHSAANYLSKMGWAGDEFWGRQVIVTKKFNWSLAGLDTTKTLKAWNRLGVRTVTKNKLPNLDIKASLLAPNGAEGPLFLVYDNFRRIMKWNRSIFYAIAIGRLADRLGYFPKLSVWKRYNTEKITKSEVKKIQTYLSLNKYYHGKIDGIVGKGMRRAVRQYQTANRLTPDGHVDKTLFEYMF
jgi:membrane-bound lytic murein transglycosylase B